MSARQPERGLKAMFKRGTKRTVAKERNGRVSNRRFDLMVTLMEERVMLSTATLTTLAVSQPSINYGSNELLTATVTTNPPSTTTPSGGLVTFKDGAMTLGAASLVGGTATLNTTHLPAGIQTINAIYGGTTGFTASSTEGGSPVINTVAGGGSPADRAAIYSTLMDPQGVVLDSAGDMFIADSDDNQVLEVSALTGAVTVVAGDGNFGYSGDGGQATDAELASPSGLAVDSSNDLFIADTFNDAIREVNLGTGVISTVAGTGTPGSTGDTGLATAALLNRPSAIAIDASGNLYIADTGNSEIREVSASTQIINTVAGTGVAGYSGDGGLATDAELLFPEGIAVDGSGDLFIADTDNNIIREVNETTQKISTIAGTDPTGATSNSGYKGDGGPATNAELNAPQGIFVTASGDLYFADTFNSAIREVNTSGFISTVAGNGSFGDVGNGGQATSAELRAPSSLTLDSAGDIFIADTGNSAIREVSGATGVISQIAGGDAFGYIGDGGPASASELAGPASVAVDSSGNLYIADSNNNAVREINALTGQITTVAGGGQAVYLPIADSADPAVDSAGDVFVASNATNQVYEIDHATGEVTPIAGDGEFGYSGDGGQATDAELGGPTGLALDGKGDLFIADTYNNVIREVNLASGVITTYAGSNAIGGAYSGDGGQATDAALDFPGAIALDSAGDLFIADTESNVIREVNATSGIITTVAGTGTAGYTGERGPPRRRNSTALTGSRLTAPAISSSRIRATTSSVRSMRRPARSPRLPGKILVRPARPAARPARTPATAATAGRPRRRCSISRKGSS